MHTQYEITVALTLWGSWHSIPAHTTDGCCNWFIWSCYKNLPLKANCEKITEFVSALIYTTADL